MMKYDLRFAVMIGLLAGGCLFASTVIVADDEQKDNVSTPNTLDEGLARIEKVLGRYNPDDQLEWRIPADSEHKSKPDPSEPEVLQISKGFQVIGHPFQEPESISFDTVWQWQRQVYDVAEDGKRTLTRTQRSHNVTRYSLSLNSGVWLVNGTMLTNGVHNSIGKSTFQGTVKWHPDGFDFVGEAGIGRYYAAGGKFILGTSHGSIKYRRQGDRLTIKMHSQPYHLSTDTDGTVLTIPDFKRPFGSPFEVEYQSEPVTAGKE